MKKFVFLDFDGTMNTGQHCSYLNRKGLPGFVTDTTPTCSHHRGDEIAAWLSLFFEISGGEDYRYVIIDDMGKEDFNNDQFDYLVCVDPFYGLNEDVCL